MSRCWFVDDNRHLFKVKRLCELVGVSRARYYRWKRPQISNRELADAWLTNAIYDIHVASLIHLWFTARVRTAPT